MPTLYSHSKQSSEESSISLWQRMQVMGFRRTLPRHEMRALSQATRGARVWTRLFLRLRERDLEDYAGRFFFVNYFLKNLPSTLSFRAGEHRGRHQTAIDCQE